MMSTSRIALQQSNEANRQAAKTTVFFHHRTN